MAIIGIDLGTTNSLICTYRNGTTELIPNTLGEYMTRSAVSLLADETVIVGALAAERLISHPQTTASSFKSYMGTEHDFFLGNKKFKAHELSAFVLRQLKQDAEKYLGETIDEAVISVPAYFNDNQRSATKLAAQLAGLSVSRLVNEPSAAALCYHAGELGSEKKYLVIDFGGGTLDVSVVDCFEHIIEIIAIAGDNRLGGDDIDEAIVAYFLQSNALMPQQISPQERASLLYKAKQSKEKIATAEEVSIGCQLNEKYHSLLLTRTLMREICAPLFSRVKGVISRALKESKVSPAALSDVLLVGGSAKFFTFIGFMEEVFGRMPTIAVNTDEIVAHGACICASIKERVIRDIVMTDVCPFSLGVGAYDSVKDKAPHMSILIQRSSLLPAAHSRHFYTLHDDQTLIRCEIFQGENYYAQENLRIGEITISVPPGPAGRHFVRITFTYDIDGILHVAAESSGGQKVSTVILNAKLSLTDSEIEKKLKELEAIRRDAEGSDGDKLIMARLERLFCELGGDNREYVQHLLSSFLQALESGDRIALSKARERAKNELLILEEELYLDPLSALDAADDQDELAEQEADTNPSKKNQYMN